MHFLPKLISALAAAALTACAATPDPRSAVRPAPAEPFVIAANPLAAKAGLEVLKRGGSAVDAAIAVQAMLSLVEPQSSGLGGGAFLHYFDARTGKLTIYDGRETAPAQAVSTMFLGPDGKPLPFNTAVLSGRATGVPGVVKMLGLAHRIMAGCRGTDCSSDAGRTAADRVHRQSAAGAAGARRFCREQRARRDRLFHQAGRRPCRRRATRLRNPAYAAFLRRLAAQGPAAMYSGATAARIVARTRALPLGGSMTARRPRRLPAGQARAGVRDLPRSIGSARRRRRRAGSH